MNTHQFEKLVKVIVEEVHNNVEEVWFSTNETEFTGEMRNRIKEEIKLSIKEFLNER